MNKLLFILIIIVSPFCLADSVYFGMSTGHLVDGQFNEKNDVTIIQSNNGFSFGMMTNSYNRESLMFGYVQPNKPVALGVLFATGYKPENLYLQDYLDSTPLVPLPLISANLKLTSTVSLTANYIAGVVLNSGISVAF